MEHKNALILGGCGFIGHALTEKLVSKGTKVTVIDNGSFGKRYVESENVSYIYGDIYDINTLASEIFPDIVYHFAEYARVEQSLSEVDRVISNNLNTIHKVLLYAKSKDAKLIYAGSSTKFGDNGSTKFSSPYALTKYLNSELVKAYCEWENLQYAIVYFYNAYGPGETNEGKYATVIGKYLKLMDNGHHSLPVSKPGTQKRNFTHIDDIVNGIVLVSEHGAGDEYGISADEEYSILEVVNVLGAHPVLIEGKKGNRLTAEVKNQKTKDLGWKASVKLIEYLQEL